MGIDRYQTTAVVQRTYDVITTSLLRQNDIATSFWRDNYIIITSFARWVDGKLETVCIFLGIYCVHVLWDTLYVRVGSMPAGLYGPMEPCI